jgi:shikimate kinase/3-dehydroquinate synthase
MRPPLLLSGFMATGKSTLGRRIAELTGAPFEDLDERIAKRAGASVSDLFRSRGEDEFRRLERLELDAVLSAGDAAVVALGGGALARREVRLDALERAVVVSLHAPLELILKRVGDDGSRPLLAGDDRETRARELLAARSAGYAEAHAHIDTGALDPERAARAAIEVWERRPVVVAAGERSYCVDVGSGIVAERVAAALGSPTRTLLVTDENVDRLHGGRLDPVLPNPARVVLRAGEEHKNVAALESIWTAAAGAELDRAGLVVALGGGVVSDVAGLAAATWKRGVHWVAAPTTLLAMVDASVGGKTAVDFARAKNVVGAFWQPRAVVCDVELLRTEPRRGFVSALAEVVKTALLGDPALFSLLEERSDRVLAQDESVLVEIVRRSVAAKARVVSRDEREAGLRATLNLGHTLGHALEASAGFGRLTHGEAVSLGLVAALRVGERLGVTPPEVGRRARDLLAQLGLPVDLGDAPLRESLSLVAQDKKRHGTYINFVLVESIGRVSMQSIDLEQLPPLLLT